MQTRKITPKEAAQCASEEVQFIGTIQPHGFCLLVDSKTEAIIQYSANFLSLLNTDLSAPLPLDTPILNTKLTQWLDCDKEAMFHSLLPKATQTTFFTNIGLISADHWECLGSVNDDDLCFFEFFPASKELSSQQILSNLDHMVAKIRLCESLPDLFEAMTEEFQKHTGYDRVMVYRFLPDWSGEVISESVSDQAEVKYLGLRFPSEDIPKKARELYTSSSLRIMADVGAIPVKLIPEILPSGKKSDQSHTLLRSMSLMHIKYLKNMGVKASMSIGLMSEKKLWGLLAFHHYSPKIPPFHLVSEMKASCELFTAIILTYLKPELTLDEMKARVN